MKAKKYVRGTDFELSNVAGSYSINATWNATAGQWQYIGAGRAFLMQHDNATGNLNFKVAVTGTAGANIAWLDRASIGESGVLDGGNRVYSDTNAPETFMMTEYATEPPTPPAGKVTIYTTDGTTLLMKNELGVVTTLGAGGGGGGSAAELAATTDYSTTMPTAPSTGIKVFARHRARRLPSFIGPTGQDSQLQPALFTNRVARLIALNNTAAMVGDSLPAPTVYTTASTAVANASTNFYSSMVRTRFASAATANSFAGFRIPNNQFFLSSTANMGGFFMVMRFGINLGTATARGFVGMTGATANETNADPSTLFNRIGFGFNSASTNWYFHSAGASTNSTTVDLGANFPARTYATNFFEFRIFVPSGAGLTAYWSAQRLNDGAFVQGGPVTTNLPAVGTLLAPHMWMNNLTATAVSMDVQSVYIETDN